jgi:hypothetical protein
MLLLLIPLAWLAILCFGLTMFRLAARSDRSQTVALAEWIRASYFAGSGELPGNELTEQVPIEPLHEPHRATG